jgi:hypothetical protein
VGIHQASGRFPRLEPAQKIPCPFSGSSTRQQPAFLSRGWAKGRSNLPVGCLGRCFAHLSSARRGTAPIPKVGTAAFRRMLSHPNWARFSARLRKECTIAVKVVARYLFLPPWKLLLARATNPGVVPG